MCTRNPDPLRHTGETIYNFDFFKEHRFVKLPPGSKFPPPESGP